MQLIPEDKLIWSPIVANSRMNRERKASGVNSCEQEFGFKPENYLLERIKQQSSVSWLDLCCGQGNALVQTAVYFHAHGLQDKVVLKGIDLLDAFTPVDDRLTCLQFQVTSLMGWQPDSTYDLITCSHGLHYLGDKFKVIQLAVGALTDTGLFIAHLDLNNIVVEGTTFQSYLNILFKRQQLQYNKKKRLLQQVGSKTIDFSLFYKGADDQAGPNYTGQDAVTSYYTTTTI